MVLLCGCSSIPTTVDKTPSYKLSSKTHNKLISYFSKNHPRNLNGVLPLINGEDALLARLASIRSAQASLDLQYYIWHEDLTGNAMLKEVVDAANRGVRVRLLLDDLNQFRMEKHLAILNEHPKIEVRLMNPLKYRDFALFNVMNLKKVNHRMHNKSLIVDNQLAIVGGRNIGDEYFDASGRYNFGDLDLWVSGPVVESVSDQFDLYWNHKLAYPVETLTDKEIKKEEITTYQDELEKAMEKARKSQYAEVLNTVIQEMKDSRFFAGVSWQEANFLYDNPQKLIKGHDKNVQSLSDGLSVYVKEVKEKLVLISPYFIPGKDGVKLFKRLRDRGVKVTVLTNSLASSDSVSVFAGYQKYRKKLLELGVELYEIKSKNKKREHRTGISSGSVQGLHTKSFIFDGKKVFVGSMNLDPRSRLINTEMGLITYKPEFASEMEQRFYKVLPEVAYELKLKDGDIIWLEKEGSEEKKFEKEPSTSWWKRFKAGFLNHLVPEKLL